MPSIVIITRNPFRSSRRNKAVLVTVPPVVWIFAITPTYARWTQKAELIRLSQTLQHVENLHWIVVEDSMDRTHLVKHLLKESGLWYTHLNVITPRDQQHKPGELWKTHHRGVSQRNLALQWLRNNVDHRTTRGVVCFMDDDNTYHRQIFEEMRKTRRVSVFGVGFTGHQRWSGPIVRNGRVVRFNSNWVAGRKFPIDMAGFAVSLEYFLKERKNVLFNASVSSGYLETTFVSDLVPTIDQLEPLATNPTKIYVWHTRAEQPEKPMMEELRLRRMGRGSDPSIEV